jgi:spore germination cell wall hydrolase CwlJ-like protein
MVDEAKRRIGCKKAFTFMRSHSCLILKQVESRKPAQAVKRQLMLYPLSKADRGAMSAGLKNLNRPLILGSAAALFIGMPVAFFTFPSESSRTPQFSDARSTAISYAPSPRKSALGLSAASTSLFAQEGKHDRADYVSQQQAADTGPAPANESANQDHVQFMAAALTPVDMSRPGPTRFAGLFRQEVNRTGKSDPLEITAVAMAKPANLNISASVEAKDASGISAALFLVSPSAFASPQNSALVDESEKNASVTASIAESKAKTSTWADLVKLARVGSGDGEKKEPTIFGALSEDEFRAREFSCMATAIYFEARGESIKGQTAVAQVIMTRVRSDYYPNTICGVVYQGQWNRNSCQFSFACDGRTDRPKNKEQWNTAINVAKKVISGQAYLKEIGDATHYHATYVSPKWKKLVKRVARIGVHIFYKADFVQPLVASADFKQL